MASLDLLPLEEDAILAIEKNAAFGTGNIPRLSDDASANENSHFLQEEVALLPQVHQHFTVDYGRTHAGQKATRRECVYTGKSKCRNTSPLELVVPDDKDYYCTRHFPKGLLGKDPDRLRCIAIKRKTGELCTKQEYKALCPDQDRRTFLCESHRNRCRGRIFRVRHGQIRTSHPYKLDRIREKPSDNLEVLIRTGRKDEIQKVRRLVFAGWKFDALTSGYGPAVKVGIRKAIEKYFETLRMTTADMERDLCSTHDSIEAFKKTLDEHHGSGYVYIMVPIAQEEESRLSIKVGWTSDPSYRFQDKLLCCGLERDRLEIFPSTQNPLNFVFLLEKILHEIWSYHQEDQNCRSTTKTHVEYFCFDRHPGEQVKEAADAIVDTMRPHIMKWMEAIQSLDDLHREIYAFHDQT